MRPVVLRQILWLHEICWQSPLSCLWILLFMYVQHFVEVVVWIEMSESTWQVASPTPPTFIALYRPVAFFMDLFSCVINIYSPCDLRWDVNCGTVFLNRFCSVVSISLRLGGLNCSCKLKGSSAGSEEHNSLNHSHLNGEINKSYLHFLIHSVNRKGLQKWGIMPKQ